MASGSWQGVFEDIRRARTAKGRLGLGAFVVEGPRMLARAHAAGAEILRVVADEAIADELSAELAEMARGPLAVAAPRAALHSLCDGRESGRLVALIQLPEAFRAAPLTEQRLVTQRLVASADLTLVALDVEEPGNVGALLRSAHATGAGFIAAGLTDPYHPKAVRTSLGSVFRVAAAKVDDSSELFDWLSEWQIRSFATVSRSGVPTWDASLDGKLGAKPTVIVVGNEARGLSTAVVGHCTPVTIPMPDGVDSFSVNAAAAILLYEVQRRRARN